MVFGGENAESYYDEGLTASMKGDLERAVQHFRHAITLDKSLLVAYHQLGKCYLRLRETQKAIEFLQHVVARKPDLVPARLDLGHALLQAGKPEEAREQFDYIASAHPDNVRAHVGLAQVSFREGRWQQAVEAAIEARAKGGTNFTVLFLLGRAAKLAGNPVFAEKSLEEAGALIQRTVELNPDSPEGYYLRGEVCFVQERFSDALEHYGAAEDRTNVHKSYTAFGESFGRVDILAKRALCLQRLGNIEEARELGGKILDLAPDHKIGLALKNL